MKLLRALTLAVAILIGGCGGGGSGSSASGSSTAVGSTAGCSATQFSSAASSAYVLPYQVGVSSPVIQGNCGSVSHILNLASSRDARYAYDFGVPVGTIVIAARGGVVIGLEDTQPSNSGRTPNANYVSVQHADGTVGRYLHNLAGTAMVTLGQGVTQGDPLVLSGASGNSGAIPHVHFDVVTFEGTDCMVNGSALLCQSVPVTFSNGSPLDTPPIQGRTYLANTF